MTRLFSGAAMTEPPYPGALMRGMAQREKQMEDGCHCDSERLVPPTAGANHMAPF